MDKWLKVMEGLLGNVEIDLKIRAKGAAEKEQQMECSYMADMIETLLGVRNDNAVARTEKQQDEDKEDEVSKDLELICITITEFMKQMMNQYPVLQGKVYHAFILEEGLLILLCDKTIEKQLEEMIKDIEKDARVKIGVDGVYIVVVNENAPLNKEEIDKIIDDVILKHELATTDFNELKTIDREENPDNLQKTSLNDSFHKDDEYLEIDLEKVLEKALEDDEDEEEKEEKLSMRELYMYLKRKGKENDVFPLSLCDEILDYLNAF